MTFRTGLCPFDCFWPFSMDVQLALITSTKVTIGIVCLLCFPWRVFFDVDARYFHLFLRNIFSGEPIHHSGHPTLKTISVLGALDKSWLRFALGCAGLVTVVFVATLLMRFDWLHYGLHGCILEAAHGCFYRSQRVEGHLRLFCTFADTNVVEREMVITLRYFSCSCVCIQTQKFCYLVSHYQIRNVFINDLLAQCDLCIRVIWNCTNDI